MKIYSTYHPKDFHSNNIAKLLVLKYMEKNQSDDQNYYVKI